ncbi:putative retrotransposon hot spot protein (RHS) [Trypanosoma cruzi]|uniref:Putative retrotransposon hot spot protein (RHS) n=1 Tax=Trypanosoma cruzi TaxID=5693 RepID=A0A2V2WXA5_TRYCR|nr:putative retrotransposon hot spot protein (RHS) [Trypanosoma cruzi]
MKDYNATGEMFIRRLDAYVNDQQLLEGILNLTYYQMYKLLHEGVFFLLQWRDYERRDTINFRAMQKLDSALEMPDGYSEQRREFTLVTKIEDVLFKRKVRVMDRKLNELLNRRFDGRGFVDANRNVLREDFLKNPEKYICDAGVLGEMQASDRYVMMEIAVRDEMDMEEDVHKPYKNGVDNLLKCLVAAEVKASVHEINKRFLDAAAEEARNPTTSSSPIYLKGC